MIEHADRVAVGVEAAQYLGSRIGPSDAALGLVPSAAPVLPGKLSPLLWPSFHLR